ncbi:MAG TPA: NAD(P)-binding protein [Burkholderiaceae bacterium]|jgi:2-polyprenyl-6-methoxyphenol hydroxylase-like FAD-dependent oxidoreductase
MHSRHIGNTAIIIGAGIGGLTAARALAEYFHQVIVLERDTLPVDPVARTGTPQDRHPHTLLGGGLSALEELFPGFEQELKDAGAVPYRLGIDVLLELPGYDPCYPRHDIGMWGYYMSRPLLEWVVRKRVLQIENIAIRQNCRVQSLLSTSDSTVVTGVQYFSNLGDSETLAADLVVDASGRGMLTMALLDQLNLPRPQETTIGVDINYATAVFRKPLSARPRDWLGIRTMGQPPIIRRGVLLMPIEEDRWMVTIAGRGEKLPSDREGFLAFAKQCRTTTVHDAIVNAQWVEEVARYRFSESVRRHFELLEVVPARLIPMGDALCQFNPVWGQGMSVAAMQARLLQDMLRKRVSDTTPLDGLQQHFLAEAQVLIDTPWRTAAYPDLADPEATGKRPADLQQELQFRAAVRRLAAIDPVVYKLHTEVTTLLSPPSVLTTPDVLRRLGVNDH